MLFKVLLVVLSSVAAMPKEKDQVPLTAKFLNEVRPYIRKCEVDTKAPPNTFQNLLNGVIETDTDRDFIYCYLIEAGFLEKDGHFIIRRLEDILEGYGDKGTVIKAFEECNKLTGKDHLETLTSVMHCYRDDVPVVFTIKKA